MALLTLHGLPFPFRLHFSELIDNLQGKILRDPTQEGLKLLTDLAAVPQFRTGFESPNQLNNNQDLLFKLLDNMFSEMLTKSEIKAVTLPYWEDVFNKTDRFKGIMQAAGDDFKLQIRDFDAHQGYVLCCCLVLNKFFNTQIDFSKPLFLDIPTVDGSIRHYRVLYNADYLHVLPKNHIPKLTSAEIELLLDNYDDLNLWKSKFPPKSYVIEGFALMTLFDATIESAISDLNKSMITSQVISVNELLTPAFRAVFKSQHLHIGLIFFDRDEQQFSLSRIIRPVYSHFFTEASDLDGENYKEFYRELTSVKKLISIADMQHYVDCYPKSFIAMKLHQQGFKSAILLPINQGEEILAVIEILSTKKELHSVNSQRLDLILPTVRDLLAKLVNDYDIQLTAVIQETFTVIHPSVEWIFKQHARYKLLKKTFHPLKEFDDIVFEQVYPLYGQIDIKGSSFKRNQCISADLQRQLQALKNLLPLLHDSQKIFDKETTAIDELIVMISQGINSGTEQIVNEYLDATLHPKLNAIFNSKHSKKIKKYFEKTDQDTGSFYRNRRAYTTTISAINFKLGEWTLFRQTFAQSVYPHYFESFKTDGIEHNIYIGSSISRRPLSYEELSLIRVWQMRLICELNQRYQSQRWSLPISMDLTSLILVYRTPIGISFRKDEKRFDVKGAYNAKYEMVKKRIDKAVIKNSKTRISQAGKLTIVYSTLIEQSEYLKYIEVLKSEGFLIGTIKHYEVEDLPGIKGLRALIIKIGNKSGPEWDLDIEVK